MITRFKKSCYLIFFLLFIGCSNNKISNFSLSSLHTPSEDTSTNNDPDDSGVDPGGETPGGENEPPETDVDISSDFETHTPETEMLIHSGALAEGSTAVNKEGSVYHLSFQGDETIQYEIDLNDPVVASGGVRVRETTSNSYPVHNGNVSYRDNSGSMQGPQYLQFFSEIVGSSMDHNSVSIEYRDVLEGNTLHRRHQFTILGKTLRIRVSASGASAQERRFNGNYNGFGIGPTEQTNNPKVVMMQGSLATPIASFMNGGDLYFVARQLDFLWSNGSDWHLQNPHDIEANGNSIDWSYKTVGLYKPTSANKLAATLDETFSIIVSKQIKEVLVQTTHHVSPFKSLAETRNTVRFTNPHSGVMSMPPWSSYLESLEEFSELGMDLMNTYFFFAWTGSSPEGNQNVGPDWAPARQDFAQPENILDHFVEPSKDFGFLQGLYVYFGSAPSGDHPSIDYDGSPLFNLCLPSDPSPSCIQNQIVRDENGDPKLGHFSGGTPWELTSDVATRDFHIEREMSIMKNGWIDPSFNYLGETEERGYGLSLLFWDVQTYATPSKGHDQIDQTEGSPWAKTQREAIIARKQAMKRARDIIGGPIFGESSIATYNTNTEFLWMSHVDSTQRVINTGSGTKSIQLPAASPLSPTSWPIIPEYEYRVFAKYQANHGNGFPDRFFSPSNGTGIVAGQTVKFPLNREALDLQRAFEFSYAHTADYSHAGANGGQQVTLRDKVNHYYTKNSITKRFLRSPLTDIRYEYPAGSGEMKSFEEILKVGYQNPSDPFLNKFIDPRLQLNFASGLELLINHQEDDWEVQRNDISYRLPKYGYLALNPDSGFISFFAKVEVSGSFTDEFEYVFAPTEYEYFNGRGKVEGYGTLNTTCAANNDPIKTQAFKNFARNLKVLEGSRQSGHPCFEVFYVNAIDETPPTIQEIEVFPKSITMSIGQEHGIIVIAKYSNGATRDITTEIQFSAADPIVKTHGPSIEAFGIGATSVHMPGYKGVVVPSISVVVR